LIIKRDHKVGPKYYDDISLISSSVCELKRIFWRLWVWTCVAWYGYQYKNPIRIGPRNDYVCTDI